MVAEWQSDKMLSDMKVCMKQRCAIEFQQKKKNGIRWHSSTLTECLWRPNSGCEHSETVGDVFQQ